MTPSRRELNADATKTIERIRLLALHDITGDAPISRTHPHDPRPTYDTEAREDSERFISTIVFFQEYVAVIVDWEEGQEPQVVKLLWHSVKHAHRWCESWGH